MDPISMAFYAVVCGALSLVAPSLPRPLARVAAGAAVGVVAALVLPWIKGMMHVY